MAEADRLSELKAFDETKTGVKGLVDTGITKIPRIFYKQPCDTNQLPVVEGTSLPVIDLKGLFIDGQDPSIREEIAARVGEASKDWGFFQIVNHGISESVLEEMVAGVRRFHEQDSEVKRQFYTRDFQKPAVFNSSYDLFIAHMASWKDTFRSSVAPNPPNPQDLPIVIRDIFVEYSKEVMKLGILIFELMSEALGLSTNRLKDIDCAKGLLVSCHYYPPCPEPELTLGAKKHCDNSYITVLLQDQNSGLQILRDNKWVEVAPLPGGLVINVGNLLKLVTNDIFKSVEHRVVVSHKPRVSITSFFTTDKKSDAKHCGPIEELLSENNPAKYKTISVKDYTTHIESKESAGVNPLNVFKVV